MTPRTEAMVVWKCQERGHLSLSVLENRVCWACYPGGRNTRVPGHPRVSGPPMEPIEVVPAAELERALDVLERLLQALESWEDKTARRDARAVLRAAGRLDG